MHVPQIEIILTHAGVELARVSLPPGEYVIGRSDDADIFADTPLISRHHARLTINYDQVLIEDLGSSNGTFVADQPIADVTRLYPNQAVRLGDVQIELRRERTPSDPGVSLAPAQTAIGRFLPDELLAGKRYAIGRQIARGGMGAILDAQQAAMKRQVAMKVMLEASEEADVLRFIDEAQITGQLEHPSIVPIYELGVDEQGQLFYTMKFVRGITLKKVIELLAQGVAGTQKKFPLPTLLTIFQKTCDAIAFAHSRDVLHRDLKPDNIMLGDFGEVLVMDGGLAKVIGTAERDLGAPEIASSRSPGGSSHTMAGSVLGTPQYMAPEQARGEVETMDQRADIYALGGILFEILHLRTTLTGMDAWDVVEKVKRGAIDWTPPKKPAPDSLLAICRKALAFDPAQRYASVAALQADLTAYQNGFATSAEKAGLAKQLFLALKRNKAAAAASALVLLAGAGFGSKAFVEGRRAEHALTALKATAPDLLRLAVSDANGQNYAAAERNIAAARALDPALPDLYWQHTWNLIGQENYAEALPAFREALARDPARASRAPVLPFLERMAATPKDRLDASLLTPVASLLRDVGALGPASVLYNKLRGNSTARMEIVRKRLEAALGKGQFSVSISPSGYLLLSLKPGAVADLEILRGLPIDLFEASFLRIKSLEPLRGMRLTTVKVPSSLIDDLSPLKGMALSALHIEGTKVSDLSPVAGMPLNTVIASSTSIVDLTPLRGAPLTRIGISGTRVSDLAPLAGAPLAHVEASGTRISSLEPLARSPVTFLEISGTLVSDLRPVRAMPLTVLKISNLAQLTDLAPLRGLGLKILAIEGNPKITDFTPLRDLPKLESIHCSGTPAVLPILRDHPTLKTINYRFFGDPTPIDRPVAEFWKLYDAQQAAGKK